jgi:N6-adenosine-specific RNA methylase IME4/ParB-like chromosome segregation protein Spo0J
MKVHPLANIFPLMEGDDFSGLVADIKANGQREPIVLFENKILDGRNRFRACSRLRLKPIFKIYKGDDPLAFVVSLNLKRRHLNESQRAWIASALVNKMQICTFDAGQMLNVSERSIKSALAVRKNGTAALYRVVDQGDLPVSQGERVAKLPNRDQDEIAADAVANGGRSVRTVINAKARIKKEKVLGKRQKMDQRVWPTKKFGVILADPPWRYDQPALGTPERAIENHYPTMSLEEICALPVGDLAADDAVLFLWVTAPKLIESTEVIKSWGFNYRTGAVWVKNKIGTGYWFRSKHEHLLVATKGGIPVPASGTQWSSVIEAPRGRHSEKPEAVFEIIEQYFPTLPKIELFQRGRAREGWDVWGDEAQEAAA